jgi:hypothetical protein
MPILKSKRYLSNITGLLNIKLFGEINIIAINTINFESKISYPHQRWWYAIAPLKGAYPPSN